MAEHPGYFCDACRDTGVIDKLVIVDKLGEPHSKDVECETGSCLAHRAYLKLAVFRERERCAQVCSHANIIMDSRTVDYLEKCYKDNNLTLKEIIKAMEHGTQVQTREFIAEEIRKKEDI